MLRCRCIENLLQNNYHMSICKCEVADVHVQVEINFAKAPTTSYNFKRSFSIFSEGCRAAWIDVHKAQPSRTKWRSSKTEMKLQCRFGPGRPLPTKCLSILGNCRKLPFCVTPLCFDCQSCGEITSFLRSDGFA